MKKFLGILAIAAVFASCDNAASDTAKEDSTRRADSIKRVEDSIKNAMPKVDSPAVKMDIKVDSPAKMEMKVDSPAKKG